MLNVVLEIKADYTGFTRGLRKLIKQVGYYDRKNPHRILRKPSVMFCVNYKCSSVIGYLKNKYAN